METPLQMKGGCCNPPKPPNGHSAPAWGVNEYPLLPRRSRYEDQHPERGDLFHRGFETGGLPMRGGKLLA